MKYKLPLVSLFSILTLSLHAQTIATTRVRLGHELFNSPHFPFIFSIFLTFLLIMSVLSYFFHSAYMDDTWQVFFGTYAVGSIFMSISLLHSNNHFIHIIALIVVTCVFIFLFGIILLVIYREIADTQYFLRHTKHLNSYLHIIENIYKYLGYTVITMILISSTVVVLSIIIMRFKNISYL